MNFKFYKNEQFKFYSGLMSFVFGTVMILGTCNEKLIAETAEIVSLPFEKISQVYSKFQSFFRDKLELQSEIEYLKEENENLKIKAENYENLKLETEKNSKYQSICNKYKNFKIASVDVKNYDFDKNIFEVTFGGNAEIHAGDAVITEKGMVGKVQTVSENSAVILSLNSEENAIGVYDESCGDIGVLRGNEHLKNENSGLMTLIPARNKIKTGDIVSTSGMSGLFPKNLRIGVIKNINFDNKTSSYVGIIALAEDFSNLNENLKTLYVISDFPGKGS